MVRTAVTGKDSLKNEDGVAYFKILPAGTYILKETKTLDGYLLSDREYKVTVVKPADGGKVVTSIDGAVGSNSNVITIKNYKEGTVGDLTISKIVAGNEADDKKPFEFIITFTGADGKMCIRDSFRRM